MTAALEALIAKARTVTMTEAQLREQRISFVYGNTHIENERITREMVIEADAKVCREMDVAEEKQATECAELEKADREWRLGKLDISGMEKMMENLLARQLLSATQEAGL